MEVTIVFKLSKGRTLPGSSKAEIANAMVALLRGNYAMRYPPKGAKGSDVIAEIWRDNELLATAMMLP